MQICPNLRSEKQVRLQLDALKSSTKSRDEIELARALLRVRIHNLVQKKKQKRASLAPAGGNIPGSSPKT